MNTNRQLFAQRCSHARIAAVFASTPSLVYVPQRKHFLAIAGFLPNNKFLTLSTMPSFVMPPSIGELSRQNFKHSGSTWKDN